MRYDKKMIERKKETINGKEVEVQLIPQGMSGANGRFISSTLESDSDYEALVIPENSSLQKEYSEYLDEGIEPDSDEIRAIKEVIEKEHTGELLDSLEIEDID